MAYLETLKEIGFIPSGNIEEDNIRLNGFFDARTTQQINVFIQLDGRERPIIITPKIHTHAFVNCVWEKLSLTQRVCVVKWFLKDYLQYRGFKNNIAIEYFSDQYQDIVFNAISTSNYNLLLSLDFIENSKGLDVLTTIAHECQHFLDFQQTRGLLDKYSGIYFDESIATRSPRIIKQIMALPLEGEIKNIKTGEIDFVTEEMRQDFLLLKNLMVAINKRKGTPRKKSNIQSQESFLKYIDDLFYFTSPLEKRAYTASAEYCKMIATNHTCLLNQEDQQILQLNQETIKRINGKIRQIQKIYQMALYNALNLELIHKFNIERYGLDVGRYICPEKHDQRNQILKHAWELSYGYYGGYTSWEEKEKQS